MRKQEQRLWDTMRRQLGNEVWLQRVENVAGEGMPDVYCAGPWVELKAARRPKRRTTPLLGADGLRQSQINWHLKAHQLGIPSYILIRDDHGALYLVPGFFAAKLNAMTQRQVHDYSVGLCWEDVELELTGSI